MIERAIARQIRLAVKPIFVIGFPQVKEGTATAVPIIKGGAPKGGGWAKFLEFRPAGRPPVKRGGGPPL